MSQHLRCRGWTRLRAAVPAAVRQGQGSLAVTWLGSGKGCCASRPYKGPGKVGWGVLGSESRSSVPGHNIHQHCPYQLLGNSAER